MQGQGTSGATGIAGTSDSGTGVHAQSTTGAALRVAGSAAVTVRMAGMSSTSLVLATLHQQVGQVAVAGTPPELQKLPPLFS